MLTNVEYDKTMNMFIAFQILLKLWKLNYMLIKRETMSVQWIMKVAMKVYETYNECTKQWITWNHKFELYDDVALDQWTLEWFSLGRNNPATIFERFHFNRQQPKRQSIFKNWIVSHKYCFIYIQQCQLSIYWSYKQYMQSSHNW